MAGDGTTYDIDLSGVKGASAVTGAADAVERLKVSLTSSEAATAAAAAAVTAGEAAYKAAENSANRAALAVEKIGVAAEAQRGKLAKAMEVGDVGAAQRAAAAIQTLTTRQAEAASKASSATAAMNAEAASLDKLKASAAGAATAQSNISKALEKAKTAAGAASKAQVAAAGSGKVNEMGEAFGKLGGPLGSVGQKLFGAAEGFKKMSGSLGSAGPYVAVAVGIIAIATAVAAVTAAAAVGIGGITLWAVRLADTDGALKKMSERLTKNMSKVFGGLKIKPLLGELEKVVDLFDENSASAKAIKAVFNSLFQPIVDGITAFVPKMVTAFIKFEILVMKALIAIKPFGSKIQEVAKWVGIAALVIAGVLAVAIGVLVVGLAGMAIGIAFALGIIGAFVLGLGWIVSKVVEVGAAIFGGLGGALDWLKGLSLSGIGTSMIDGLIAGITGAAGGVLKAMTGAVGGAISAATSLLQINSPSKVFASIGASTGEGMVDGIDESASDVQGSMESMVAPPDGAPGSVPAATASGGGGFNFAGAQFIFHGIKDTGDAADQLREAFALLLTQTGGGTPSAA